MTALFSFLCSEPLLSSCHPRRNTCTNENEYLIDSDSWDAASMPGKSDSKMFKEHCSTKDQSTSSCRQQPRFQRLISFVSALNPLKMTKDEDSANEYLVPKQNLSSTQTVSFAAVSPMTSSYNQAMLNDDEDYEIRHFAIVDITPGGKPLFISDARHCDRNKWFSRKTAQSFDVALRRRRSLSCARMNRRAYSLNKMAELDANARRAAYSQQRANRRPESEFIDAKTYNGRPMFYAFDEDANLDSNDLYALEWNHPARGAFLSQFFESSIPPRPPKPKNYRDGSPNSRTYVNEVKPPPRPPKHQFLCN